MENSEIQLPFARNLDSIMAEIQTMPDFEDSFEAEEVAACMRVRKWDSVLALIDTNKGPRICVATDHEFPKRGEIVDAFESMPTGENLVNRLRSAAVPWDRTRDSLGEFVFPESFPSGRPLTLIETLRFINSDIPAVKSLTEAEKREILARGIVAEIFEIKQSKLDIAKDELEDRIFHEFHESTQKSTKPINNGEADKTRIEQLRKLLNQLMQRATPNEPAMRK